MRRAKQLALGALMALALSVFGASSASAAGFLTDGYSYPATLEGEALEEKFSFETRELNCSGGNLQGEVGSLVEASALETTSAKTSCTFFNGSTATLQMNGCGFEFHPGSESSKEKGLFEGTFDIGPPGCGPITWSGPTCTISIHPKTGLPITYRNEGTGATAKVLVKAEVKSGIKYSAAGGNCFFLKEGENGQLFARWLTQAKYQGSQTGLHVGEIPNGIQVVGKEGGEGPRIEAEAYPASLSASNKQAIGAETEFFYIPVFGRKVECEKADFAATLTGPTAALPIDTVYSGLCRAGGTLKTEVRMNSCDYVLNVLNVGPPYSGSYDIACTKEGDTIEFATWNLLQKEVVCTTKIGPQSSLSSVKLSNESPTEWWIPRVTLDVRLKGIGYTHTSGNEAICGQAKGTTKAYSDGSYVNPKLELRGFLD
jgi:hypothetical protein